MSLAKIGNKIFSKEVELSKEQIELNLISELQKQINEGISEGDKMKNFLDELDKLNDEFWDLEVKLEKKKKDRDSSADAVKSKGHNVRAMYSRASKNYEKLINTASDLGAKYPKNIDTNMKALEKMVELSNNLGKRFK